MFNDYYSLTLVFFGCSGAHILFLGPCPSLHHIHAKDYALSYYTVHKMPFTVILTVNTALL